MLSLQCQDYSISSLVPRTNNPRTHNRKQRRQIEASIRRFGFTNPVLIDDNQVIIAGHGRVEAAKNLGIEKVPVIVLSHMSEAEKRAYVIADNRLAELAGWDNEILAIEFQYLTELEFDVVVTGFELPEIDLLVDGIANFDSDAADVIPETAGGVAVSSRGDLWGLGGHLLLCGDATDWRSYARLMGGGVAQVAFADVPYNVPIHGHVCGAGAVKHREFAMASGEMSEGQFIKFLISVFGFLATHSDDGSIHFVCMDWRHIYELLCAGREIYTELKNICVWNKTNGGMGSFYRSKHEFVAVFKNGTKPHINNVQLGRHGRNRTNVWDYAGISSMTADRAEQLAMHPTVKPVAMVADALLDCSDRGGIVLDPFGGSGTTLLAAERTGRKARLMEIDPAYVDVTIRRYQNLTGDKAYLADGGGYFDDFDAVINRPMEAFDAD